MQAGARYIAEERGIRPEAKQAPDVEFEPRLMRTPMIECLGVESLSGLRADLAAFRAEQRILHGGRPQ